MLQVDTNQSENIKKVDNSEIEYALLLDYYLGDLVETENNYVEDGVYIEDDCIVEYKTFYQDSQNLWYRLVK